MLTFLRDRIRDDEQGVTLIELLVVTIVMGVISTVTLASFVSSGRVTVAATAQIDAINNVTPAMQRLTRDVRVASPLVIDAGGDYNNRIGTEFVRGGVTYRNNYYVQAGATGLELFTDRFRIAADGTVTTIGTSNLLALIDNVPTDATEKVFTYFDSEGNEITCITTTAVCRDAHVTATKIGVHLIRAVDGDRGRVDYQTIISVRNTRYGS